VSLLNTARVSPNEQNDLVWQQSSIHRTSADGLLDDWPEPSADRYAKIYTIKAFSGMSKKIAYPF
jgi:hypothetical protein